MFETVRRVDAAIEEHQLSNLLGCIGGVCYVLSFPLSILSVWAVTSGTASLNPPEAITPIIEAGWGFIFNRWFWASMLLVGIMGQIFAYWSHPETQLKRKLGKIAVQEYQQIRGWPWE